MKLKHLVLTALAGHFIYIIYITIFKFSEVDEIIMKDNFYSFILVLSWVWISIALCFVIVNFIIKHWNTKIL